MCYKIFTTNGEHKNVVRVCLPQGVGVPGKLHIPFPAFPASMGENSLPAVLSGEFDPPGGLANDNASWAGRGISHGIFSSSHTFSQESLLRLL